MDSLQPLGRIRHPLDGSIRAERCTFRTAVMAIREAAWGLPVSPPKPWAPQRTGLSDWQSSCLPSPSPFSGQLLAAQSV